MWLQHTEANSLHALSHSAYAVIVASVIAFLCLGVVICTCSFVSSVRLLILCAGRRMSAARNELHELGAKVPRQDCKHAAHFTGRSMEEASFKGYCETALSTHGQHTVNTRSTYGQHTVNTRSTQPINHYFPTILMEFGHNALKVYLNILNMAARCLHFFWKCHEFFILSERVDRMLTVC